MRGEGAAGLVVTLLPEGPEEVIDAQLAFHLNAGADLVLAAAAPADPEVEGLLARYERLGSVRRVDVGGRGEADARTALGRLAAREHGAAWVIHARPGEFWWPRGESLVEVLAAVPGRYAVVQALRRPFLFRGGDEPFSERMTERMPVPGPGPASPGHLLRPAHRGDPEVAIGADGSVTTARGIPLRGWYPMEALELPVRLPEGGAAERPAASAVVDTRLRDSLRRLRELAAGGEAPGRFAVPAAGGSRLSFPVPDLVDEARYAVECAAVGEVALDRLEEQVADLTRRVARAEARLWPRLYRLARRLARGRRTGALASGG